MIRRILTGLTAIGMTLVFPAIANADHAQEWLANGDSFVVSQSTVHLEGDNTSVETAALGVNVDAGDEISFHYELLDEAECTGGAPRVFVVVNGVNTNSWDQLQPSGEQCGVDGTVTFTAANAGLITTAGLVYDNGAGGAVEITDLTVAGEAVHFMNPPEVCEFDESLLAGDSDCIEPEDDVTPDPEDETTPDPVDTQESETSTPDPETTPVAASGDELPKTGPNAVWAGVLGAVLVLFGIGALLVRRAGQ